MKSLSFMGAPSRARQRLFWAPEHLDNRLGISSHFLVTGGGREADNRQPRAKRDEEPPKNMRPAGQ